MKERKDERKKEKMIERLKETQELQKEGWKKREGEGGGLEE